MTFLERVTPTDEIDEHIVRTLQGWPSGHVDRLAEMVHEDAMSADDDDDVEDEDEDADWI